MNVEVLIPHFNRADSLRRTLVSLRTQTVPCDVCVIDNGSTDHTPQVVAEFQDVRYLALPRNLGFGAAVNRGAISSSAHLLIFLNNDAVADASMVEEFLSVQEASNVAMVAGCLRAIGGEIETLGIEMDQSLIAYDIGFGRPYEAARDAVVSPIAPCGGAAAFLRDPFIEQGGFDEAIFAYLEDVELGLRMQFAGYECAAAPRAFAWHEHSGTLGSGSAAKNELLSWSRAYIVWKHGHLLTASQRARGAALDWITIVGKVAVDRNLGALKGRLRVASERRLARSRPSGPHSDRRPEDFLKRMSFSEALKRRLSRRALSSAVISRTHSSSTRP